MLSPEKHMNAMAIKPTVMKVMPSPCSGFGTMVYAIFSRIAARATIAQSQLLTSKPKACHHLLSEGSHPLQDDKQISLEGCTLSNRGQRPRTAYKSSIPAWRAVRPRG